MVDGRADRANRPRVIDNLARRAFLARLRSLRKGQLILIDGDERYSFGAITTECALKATLVVRDRRFYGSIGLGGTLGAGEAYIDGFWTADDLTALVRIMALNPQVAGGLDSGLARLAQPLRAFYHFLNKNTERGSRRNIAAHYDLGNDFFALFLDESMMYSCAIFEREGMSLREASLAKVQRICRKLRLGPADHLLEIGAGWGGFALHAAANYGCRVTTTTISKQQHALAVERIAKAGLAERVTVLLEDYRKLEGQYDKLVSIEMIEAVGHHFLDAYFGACSRLLRPQGLMLLQAITIADQEFEAAARRVDFIKRYIFPGSCIPSVGAICHSITRATDLRLVHLEDLTPHYATTLRAWRERMFAQLDRVRALGYSDEFIRMWEFYLCYCEGGFAERYIGDVQMLFAKPLARQAPILPPLAASQGTLPA